MFAALSNESRRRCMMLLGTHEQPCVCELTHVLGLSQPRVSRHLAQLRESGLVSDRRAGAWVYYRIRPGLAPWALAVLKQTVRGLASQPPFSVDARRLADMPNRPDTARRTESSSAAIPGRLPTESRALLG